MASIDERIVSMTFKGAGFLAGAASVINALEKLKSSLGGLKGGGKALSDIDAAGKKIDLSGISKGVDSIASHFGALGIAATAALATVASMAVMAGARLLKSLTITPILAGLDIYSTKLNAIQTIMANTLGQSGSNVTSVTAALDELNQYANLTIYRFGDMAHNIGLFTAAGVGIKDSVSSIKGLANIAALSGASTQQAASAMYQMSQAIASGTIRLMDWNSVVNAGMGGKVFQNSLIQTARAHGVAVDAMIKKNGSFRDSLQEGWLTSDIMTETLSKFTGDLSAAQLKAMGYTDKQTKAIMAQAKAAVDSATKVKTITQLMEVMSDSIATAWAKVWEAVIGNLPQATALLTGVSNGLSNVFVAPIQHLGDLLLEWNKLGGRATLINALTDGMKILGSVLKPIGQAFRDVFPASTAQGLVNLTNRFHDFVNSLKPSTETLANLHKIFEGLFSGLKIGMDVFKGVVGVVKSMIGAATGAGTGVLGLAARFGTFLSNLRKSIESGTAFNTFFKNMGTILSAPVRVLSSMVQGLNLLAGAAGKALGALKPFFDWVGKAFSGLGQAITDSIKSGDFSSVMTAINGVLMGGVLLAIRKFINNFGKSLGGGLGLVDQIKGIFGGLTASLTAMQNSINAGTLKKIAIAILLITASVVALSMIDAGKLSKSLTAITVMFTQLLAALAVVSKITPAGIAQMAATGIALNLLASAILILAAAVALLSRFSWGELAKGISAIAVMLGVLVAAVSLLSKNAPGLIASATAMIAMAIALNLLAIAVGKLGQMDWTTLGKGVGAITALLAVLGAFNKFGGVQLIGTAVSMLVLGAALNVLALAVKQFASMSISELAAGLISVAAGLVIIAAGMSLMPPNMLVTAAGLLVVSAALMILSQALGAMGGMSWSEVAKSLVELAGSLVIIAAAMMLMTGALPGAAALLVIAGALTVLTPVLMALGSMSIGALVTSLGALAGVFLVLGAAGLLLTPLAPTLLAIGAALLLFGAGVLAVGGGVALLGIGLTAIGVAVMASGAAILSFVTGILNLIPLAMAKIGAGIVAFAGAISKGGVAITNAFTAVLTALLNAIIRIMPLVGRAISQILDTILRLVVQYSPRAAQAFAALLMACLNTIAANIGRFVQRGTDIVVGFLRGIAANTGRVVRAGADVVIAFINGVSAQLPRITQAGINAIISFVNALAGQIRGSSGALRSAGFNLAAAIIDGLTGGLFSLAGRAIGAAASIGQSILGALGKAIQFFSPSHKTFVMGVALAEGLALGLEGQTPRVVTAAEKSAKLVLDALSGMTSSIEDTIDIQPTITPVIDLSRAKRGFDDLAAMSRAGISTDVAMSAASSISAVRAPVAAGAGVVTAGGTTFSFVQNNTSPKALSEAEIYRQTKNQLSIVKGALPS